MNVSFTRARSKLVIFGSRTTLENTLLLQGFFQLMDIKGWVLPLPMGAEILHNDVITKSKSGIPMAKRTADVLDDEKENIEVRSQDTSVKKRRKAVEHGVFNRRPVLRDVFNGSK